MSLYDTVRNLPLHVDGYYLEPLEREVARGFTLRRTVVVLHGKGEEGRGEEVDYDAHAQEAFQADEGKLPFPGEHTHRLVLAPAGGPDRVPALGIRVGGPRSRASSSGPVARRGGRP